MAVAVARDRGQRAVASRQLPRIPAVGTAPADARARAVAAPVPARPRPPVLIPAIRLAEINVLRLLDQHWLSLVQRKLSRNGDRLSPACRDRGCEYKQEPHPNAHANTLDRSASSASSRISVTRRGNSLPGPGS